MSDDPVLQALNDVSIRLRGVEGAVGDVKVEVVAVKTELGQVKTLGEATHAQAKATNGRVGKLEKAKLYADGVRAGTSWIPKLAFGLAIAIAGGAAGTLAGHL